MNICLKSVICTTQMEHCFKMIVGQDLTINKMVKLKTANIGRTNMNSEALVDKKDDVFINN